MNILINDTPLVLPDNATLADALMAKGIKPGGIATAVNGTVIPSAKRVSHHLCEGDKVVIIKAFYGG